MQKIGGGFYYTVYDIGGGRVRKKLTSYIARTVKLIHWGRVKQLGFWNVVSPRADGKRVLESIERSKEIIVTIKKDCFGNPTFINAYEYEQDRAIACDALFEQQKDAFLRHVRDYIAFQKLLWTHGYADTVYNFTLNTGISEKTGEFVCIDFNEFSRNKEKILPEIERKKWETQKSLRDFPRELADLKKEILALFEKEFTKVEFEKLWQTALK